MITKYKHSALKRQKRLRARIKTRSHRLRLSVFRSHRQIYAQIIDDATGRTLVSASHDDLTKSDQGQSKRTTAKLVGEILGKKAAKVKIKHVVFDRGKYRYHGRIKELADGARNQGLSF